MNPLFHTRKRSAVTALAAVACFSTVCDLCSADEAVAAGTQQKSPRTVIEDNLPPVPVKSPPESYRAPIRLATGAAARGWLGRMPERRQTSTPKSVLPPPAPLMEPVDPMPVDSAFFPAPVPPATIRRTNDTATRHRLSRGATLAPPIGSDVFAPQSVSNSKKSLQVKPISQSESPATQQSSENQDAATDDTTPAVSDVDLLLYGRPLANVSLSSAIQAETLSGEVLKTPDDQAGQIFSGYGVYQELPAMRYGSRWQANQTPMFFNPLYFEDPNLERCGQGHGCFTELVSAVRFFGRVPVVPYMMGANPPLSCVPSLGDCPTCHVFGCDAYLPPLDKDAAALQTACTVGLIFLLP